MYTLLGGGRSSRFNGTTLRDYRLKLGCFYSMYICKKLLQPHRYYSFFISAR